MAEVAKVNERTGEAECFIVHTDAGEYEDRTEEIYRVCFTKESAELVATRLRGWLDGIGQHKDGDRSGAKRMTRPEFQALQKEFSNIAFDWTGTRVYVSGPYDIEP